MLASADDRFPLSVSDLEAELLRLVTPGSFNAACRSADTAGMRPLALPSREERMGNAINRSAEERIAVLEQMQDDMLALDSGRPNGGGILWEHGRSPGGVFAVEGDEVELMTRGRLLRRLVEQRGMEEATPNCPLPAAFVSELIEGVVIKVKQKSTQLVYDLESQTQSTKKAPNRVFPHLNSERSCVEDYAIWDAYCTQQLEQCRRIQAIARSAHRQAGRLDLSSILAHGRRARQNELHYLGMQKFMREHWLVVCKPALRMARRHSILGLRVSKCHQVFNYMNAVRRLFCVYRMAVAKLHPELWELCGHYEPPAKPKSTEGEYFDSHGARFWQEVGMGDDESYLTLPDRLVRGPQLAGAAGQKAATNASGAVRPKVGKRSKLVCPVCKGAHVKRACPTWIKSAEGKKYCEACKKVRGGLSRAQWIKANPNKKVPVPPGYE